MKITTISELVGWCKKASPSQIELFERIKDIPQIEAKLQGVIEGYLREAESYIKKGGNKGNWIKRFREDDRILFYMKYCLVYYRRDKYEGDKDLDAMTDGELIELKPKQIIKPTIPPELTTPKALEVLQKAVDNNLLNKDWTLTTIINTKALAALLAEYLSDEIGLTTTIKEGKETKKRRSWKPFETIWQMSGFATQRYKDQIKKGEEVDNK